MCVWESVFMQVQSLWPELGFVMIEVITSLWMIKLTPNLAKNFEKYSQDSEYHLWNVWQFFSTFILTVPRSKRRETWNIENQFSCKNHLSSWLANGNQNFNNLIRQNPSPKTTKAEQTPLSAHKNIWMNDKLVFLFLDSLAKSRLAMVKEITSFGNKTRIRLLPFQLTHTHSHTHSPEETGSKLLNVHTRTHSSTRAN